MNDVSHKARLLNAVSTLQREDLDEATRRSTTLELLQIYLALQLASDYESVFHVALSFRKNFALRCCFARSFRF